MFSLGDELAFDPNGGSVIRTPAGDGYGHWVGGHKVHYDADTETFVLFYRIRSPLEQGRGGICRVATSRDGVAFSDVWEAGKQAFAASSIEVGHCIRTGDEWRLYVSYEITGTATWRIDVMRAEDLESFDTQARRTILQPSDFDIAWIKDPVVMIRNGRFQLFAAVPARAGPRVDENVVHARALDATVLCESDDGLYFPSLEYVFEAPATDSWHGRRARINSVFEIDDAWLATYDGGRTFYDNYEEHCGLATSHDGVRFRRLDQSSPWIPGIRYVYGLPVGDRVFFYYEFTRPDGSHDLRVSIVDR